LIARQNRAYLEEHGKPVAFYSDKHGIFRVNRKETAVLKRIAPACGWFV